MKQYNTLTEYIKNYIKVSNTKQNSRQYIEKLVQLKVKFKLGRTWEKEFSNRYKPFDEVIMDSMKCSLIKSTTGIHLWDFELFVKRVYKLTNDKELKNISEKIIKYLKC